MYADASRLLVFEASLTSVSLSKNKFFDKLKLAQNRKGFAPALFYFFRER